MLYVKKYEIKLYFCFNSRPQNSKVLGSQPQNMDYTHLLIALFPLVQSLLAKYIQFCVPQTHLSGSKNLFQNTKILALSHWCE